MPFCRHEHARSEGFPTSLFLLQMVVIRLRKTFMSENAAIYAAAIGAVLIVSSTPFESNH